MIKSYHFFKSHLTETEWHYAGLDWIIKLWSDIWGVISDKNGKETYRWGVAEIQKMSPPTTGRCYQTMEWGEPTNGSVAQRHSSQSQLYSFFGVVDQTLTHYFGRPDGKLFLSFLPILLCRVWWWWCTVSLLGNTSQLESCSAAHQAMVSTPTAAAATLDTPHHTR